MLSKPVLRATQAKLAVSVHRGDKAPRMAEVSPGPPLWSPGFSYLGLCTAPFCLSGRKLKSCSPVGGYALALEWISG